MIGTRIGIGRRKTFWQKYSKFVLIALGSLLLVYGGVQYYLHYQSNQSLEASAIYDDLLSAVQKKDKEKTVSEATVLMQRYEKTPYASLAALLLAKLDVDEKNLDAAISHLRFALKEDEKHPIQQIARVRLARVLAGQKNYQEALEILTEKKYPDGYITLFEETKGDIYLMQNDKEKAKEAYQKAINAAPPGVPVSRLQLKQADLGVQGDPS